MHRTLIAFGLAVVVVMMIAAFPHIQVDDGKILVTGSKIQFAAAGYDSYTKLMLHFDGTNGSTVFTDEVGKTVTAEGDAQINTAQKKFGTGSGLFDGSGDYLSFATNDDFAVGTGDFTIDFWVYFTLFKNWISVASTTRGAGGWNFGTQAAKQFVWYSSSAEQLRSTAIFTISTWHHVAVTRSGTNFRSFIDGVGVATNVNSENFTVNTFLIANLADAKTEPLSGYLDEFRFSKGIARWTNNFTPPTNAYTY